MDKETLLNGLGAALGETGQDGYLGDSGVSRRTLETYAEKILPSLGETEGDENFFGVHADILRTMGGQMRKEKADFVKDYIKRHKEEPTPKKAEGTKPTADDGGERGNDPVSELLRRIENLEKEREAELVRAQSAAMSAEVEKQGTMLKVSNEALWRDAARMVDYSDGKTRKEAIEEAKRIYEEKQAEYFGEGVSPYGGTDRMQEGDPKEALAKKEAFKDRMRSQGKLPKK